MQPTSTAEVTQPSHWIYIARIYLLKQDISVAWLLATKIAIQHKLGQKQTQSTADKFWNIKWEIEMLYQERFVAYTYKIPGAYFSNVMYKEGWQERGKNKEKNKKEWKMKSKRKKVANQVVCLMKFSQLSTCWDGTQKTDYLKCTSNSRVN